MKPHGERNDRCINQWTGQVDGNNLPIFAQVLVDYQPRTQWGDKPAEYWRERAREREEVRRIQRTQIEIFDSDSEPQMPCGCYDG
ncbi:MAG: hypothetical protein WAO55_06985 [Candidatus Manganitrophaceae bacterium]